MARSRPAAFGRGRAAERSHQQRPRVLLPRVLPPPVLLPRVLLPPVLAATRWCQRKFFLW